MKFTEFFPEVVDSVQVLDVVSVCLLMEPLLHRRLSQFVQIWDEVSPVDVEYFWEMQVVALITYLLQDRSVGPQFVYVCQSKIHKHVDLAWANLLLSVGRLNEVVVDMLAVSCLTCRIVEKYYHSVMPLNSLCPRVASDVDESFFAFFMEILAIDSS